MFLLVYLGKQGCRSSESTPPSNMAWVPISTSFQYVGVVFSVFFSGAHFWKVLVINGPGKLFCLHSRLFFNSVAVIMVKLSVNKSNGLIFLNMTRAFIVYILI